MDNVQQQRESGSDWFESVLYAANEICLTESSLFTPRLRKVVQGQWRERIHTGF